jgi:hypothetical protein
MKDGIPLDWVGWQKIWSIKIIVGNDTATSNGKFEYISHARGVSPYRKIKTICTNAFRSVEASI